VRASLSTDDWQLSARQGVPGAGALAAALGRAGTASSLRSLLAPGRPSVGERKELVAGSRLTYQCVVSQPAEILTI
jgi:hypothetical protein